MPKLMWRNVEITNLEMIATRADGSITCLFEIKADIPYWITRSEKRTYTAPASELYFEKL